MFSIAFLQFNRLLQLGLFDLILSLIDTVLEILSESYVVWKMKLQLTESFVDKESFCSLCREAILKMNSVEVRVRYASAYNNLFPTCFTW